MRSEVEMVGEDIHREVKGNPRENKFKLEMRDKSNLFVGKI